ncbi:MAG: FAD-binding oxidoreductase [Chitinophagaceae bacterium]|nr:FAD-binding oxidoreductase [Chitinophagaceae bacterium]MCB9045633.1 FAD-binding oxidoreductase [Chitinophagales bacterium]
MFSYWEQQSFFKYDHIVIGSGITGLSTAIELRAKYPHASVLVLERGLVPAGASTRNAGFACMGSVTELLDDLEVMSEAEVVGLFEQRKRGLALLRSRLGDEAIGYAENGSYELIDANAKEALNHIDYLNGLLLPVNNKPSFRLANERIKSSGFSEKYTEALIENTCEGELNTGMMMRALAAHAIEYGVEIKTGARVAGYEEKEDGVLVVVENTTGIEPYLLRCTTLNICTNAFTGLLLPGEDIIPGRGQVLVTRPIPGLKFKGIYHFDKGYYYFREIDGRILLGGGRNLDFEGERTGEAFVTEMIQENLEQKLREVIIPGVDFEIERRWAGIMAFGENKQPIIKVFSNRVFGAFRFGGMGVALGSRAGYELVQLHDTYR